MADGPALALQAALIGTLKANAGVAALVGARVYDEPPQTVVFPYVRIGTVNVDILRMSGECADDDVIFSIEAHSRPVSGRVEASRIAHVVRLALDNTAIAPVGYHVDWCDFETHAVTRAVDGKSYIATIAFTAALSAA